MSALRLGLRVPPCARADRLVDTVHRAEALGFDRVWFPDSQLLWRDVFTVLTAAALGTERIGLAGWPRAVRAICAWPGRSPTG
jgi:5,10-methylenetetrahydromethanopterin reductase